VPSPSDRPAAIVDPQATIREGVTLAAGVVVEAHALLGKAPRLAAHSRGAVASGASSPALIVAEDARIGVGAVVFAAASIGPAAIVEDRAVVRERARVGAGSVIGSSATIDNDVNIGERVRIGPGAYLTAHSIVEDDVTIGAGVTTTNDDTMGRHPRSDPLRGAILRRGCQIGAAAVLTPGVEVGEKAHVAPGALVTRDVPAGASVSGAPARVEAV
jgi:UDP-2-acetamido-3-amino-2,3-dideoxy-glucuronate N-acetyltransferase